MTVTLKIKHNFELKSKDLVPIVVIQKFDHENVGQNNGGAI